jgi:hypothetical protein
LASRKNECSASCGRGHFVSREGDERDVSAQENEKLLDERAKVLKDIAKEKEKDEELKKYKSFCDDYKRKVDLPFIQPLYETSLI